jgi:hypothetical protein
MSKAKQTKKKEYIKLKNDDRRDIAIDITNKLIQLGYVRDCTDTDDESEFEVQDMIVESLKQYKLKILTYNINLSK